MAATGILRILGTITNLLEGEETVGPFEFQTAAAVGERRSPVSFATGFNPIAVPALATVMILIPPAGNAQTLILKGVTGDTGVRLHKTFPSVIPMDAGANATIGITAGGAVTAASIIFI